MVVLSDIRNRIKSDLVLPTGGTDYDDQIDDAIRSALRELRQSKHWFLETVSSLTLASAASTIDLSTDVTNFSVASRFAIIVSGLRYTHSHGFDFLSYEKLEDKYWRTNPLETGTPAACAVKGSTLYFSHIADAAYTVPIDYYKQDAALPTAAQTSVWFDDGLDVVRSKAMLIFKIESQHYDASEKDTSLINMYMSSLNRRHEKFEGSR